MVVFGGDEVSALVFDVGSRVTKAGYAGEDCPSFVFSSHVGSKVDDSLWRSNAELASPLGPDSLVQDWDAYELIWSHLYENSLRTKSSDHPLLICEPSWNTRQQREKMLELAFEKFDVPALYFGRSAVLSAFASGRGTAMVIDSGASNTSVVPVFDGYVLKKTLSYAPLGGDFVSDQILKHLHAQNIEVVPRYLVASKQAVESDAKPIYVRKERPHTTHSYHMFAVEQVLQEFKELVCHIPETRYNETLLKKRPNKHFEFPNGFNHPFGAIRHRFTEGLFDASAVLTDNGQPPADTRTIQQLIFASGNEVDVDTRAQFYNNLVVTGGNSMIPGFADRIYNEVHTHSAGSKVKIHAAGGSSERKFGAWIGGSMFASMASFHQLWISKEQYEESGLAVEKKIH